MRHRIKGSKLGRTASHKKATIRSLSIALLTHHRIVTTLTKAKELRRHVEPVINRSKEDTTHNRREVFSFLQDNKSVSKIFDEIGPKVADRPGGYTRIVKIGTRVGDSAEMAIIELVDYNESDSSTTGAKKKRTRRAGKSTTKASETKAAMIESDKPAEPAADEAVVVEDTVVEDTSANETSEAPETEEIKDSTDTSDKKD